MSRARGFRRRVGLCFDKRAFNKGAPAGKKGAGILIRHSRRVPATALKAAISRAAVGHIAIGASAAETEAARDSDPRGGAVCANCSRFLPKSALKYLRKSNRIPEAYPMELCRDLLEPRGGVAFLKKTFVPLPYSPGNCPQAPKSKRSLLKGKAHVDHPIRGFRRLAVYSGPLPCFINRGNPAACGRRNSTPLLPFALPARPRRYALPCGAAHRRIPPVS